MTFTIRSDIAKALSETVYFSGYKPTMTKVDDGAKGLYRVSAGEAITIEVVSPTNIRVKTKSGRKTFNSEYRAKSYIVSEILEK